MFIGSNGLTSAWPRCVLLSFDTHFRVCAPSGNKSSSAKGFTRHPLPPPSSPAFTVSDGLWCLQESTARSFRYEGLNHSHDRKPVAKLVPLISLCSTFVMPVLLTPCLHLTCFSHSPFNACLAEQIPLKYINTDVYMWQAMTNMSFL